ncbi:MipA/OmpV family protein [Paraglaciecola sp. L3A3]|uniref:MipA/OmpV family protein n=1 Tax=Paraglaciecola sp. L3A3 TaxID=2686358 RepID=UPI00131A8957|nr:MipA/OmpV family protein [Paraglaciecola sp. L3A3]
MQTRCLFKLLLASFCFCSAGVFAQSNNQPTANVHSDNPEGKFSWSLTIATDIVLTESMFIGAEQDQDLDFVNISILLDLYYKGFFIQTNKHRFGGYANGAEVGYELEVNDQYEIDLINKMYLPGFSSSYVGTIDTRDIPELEGIKDREFISSQGIRYMRYLSNSVYWIDLAANIFGDEHSGWVVDGFYSYILQKRNWDINLGVGASFYSSNMNNYYFSIKPEEATQIRTEYKPGAGYRLQIEAFVQRPINEDWLFNGGLTISHYSKSIADSPIVVRENEVTAQIGFSYVF